jgi:hypothetical protein
MELGGRGLQKQRAGRPGRAAEPPGTTLQRQQPASQPAASHAAPPASQPASSPAPGRWCPSPAPPAHPAPPYTSCAGPAAASGTPARSPGSPAQGDGEAKAGGKGRREGQDQQAGRAGAAGPAKGRSSSQPRGSSPAAQQRQPGGAPHLRDDLHAHVVDGGHLRPQRLDAVRQPVQDLQDLCGGGWGQGEGSEEQ